VSPKRESLPLAYVLYKRVGFRRATRALEYVVSWGLATEDLGHEVSVSEYGVYWKISLSHAYADREAWVVAAPGVDVSEVWSSVRDRIAERKDRKLALMQMIGVSIGTV
jgi:hypothetical protein